MLRYCTMQCFYQDNLCSYIKLQHTSISIPRYLPVNTDFLQLHPYIPPSRGSFERQACYCATYFYPVENSNHLFGVYQIGQVGILYNRVVFDEPGFYQFQVVSDYLSNGNIVSRTTFHVFLDVADYMFWGFALLNSIMVNTIAHWSENYNWIELLSCINDVNVGDIEKWYQHGSTVQ